MKPSKMHKFAVLYVKNMLVAQDPWHIITAAHVIIIHSSLFLEVVPFGPLCPSGAKI
jgi:hypothetical protein